MELVLGHEKFLPTLAMFCKERIKEYSFPGSHDGKRIQKMTFSKPKQSLFDIGDILDADSIWKSLEKKEEEETSALDLSYDIDRISKQLEYLSETTNEIYDVLQNSTRRRRLT